MLGFPIRHQRARAGYSVVRLSSSLALLSAAVLGACDAATAPRLEEFSGIRLSLPQADLLAGDTARAQVTLIAQNGAPVASPSAGAARTPGEVVFSSSDPSIVNISRSGLILAQKQGEATITASYADLSTTSKVRVNGHRKGIVVSPKVDTLQSVGHELQLSAVVLDAQGREIANPSINWTSLNPSVASVSSSGRVTALAAGIALITAASRGAVDTAAVHVLQAATAVRTVSVVEIKPGTVSADIGQKVQLAATVKDGSGNTLAGVPVTWSTSDPAVATVDGYGVVTAQAAGAATIRATAEGKTGSASVTVRAPESSPPPSSGSTSSGWSNEPAGMTALSNQAWSTGSLPAADLSNRVSGWWRWDPGNNASIVNDGTAPTGSSGVLQYRYRAGMGTGYGPAMVGFGSGDQPLRVSGRAVEELYIAFYVKFSDWTPEAAQMTKLFYTYQEGNDPQPSRNVLHPNLQGPGPFKLNITSEVMLDDGPSVVNYHGNVSDPTLYPNTWYKIEIYTRKSSRKGAKDGVLRWWINGKLAGDHTNILRSHLPFTEFHGDPVWGGSGDMVKPKDEFIWFDHIYISAR